MNAAEIAGVQRGKEFDLVFTSPPFFEMEHYSELEGGLPTMAPEGFQQAYAAILAAAAAHLADHRLMVIITGDVRGEDGSPLNLVGLNPRGDLWCGPQGREHSELPATARFSAAAHQRIL